MNSLTPRLKAAVHASTAGDSATAMRLLKQAMSESPPSALAHYLMGAELASSGAMAEAESAMATAVVLDGSLVMARYQLGLLQYTDGRVAMALLTWEPLLSLDESSPLRHLVHGFGLLTDDQLAEARACFQAAFGLSESNRALQSDTLKILERIDHSIGTQSAGAAEDPVHPYTGSENTAEESDLNHVLLSNYQSQGRPH